MVPEAFQIKLEPMHVIVNVITACTCNSNTYTHAHVHSITSAHAEKPRGKRGTSLQNQDSKVVP